MRKRLSQPTKGRLKRESFIHQSRILERRQEDILDHDPKEIPPCLAVPAWSERTSPIIRCTIPGVGQKDSQRGPERKSLTQEYLQTNYPTEYWTLRYTDGSAENAVQNGGAGVYIQYVGGKEDKISLATGLYSANYKAEAEALKTAAAHIEVSTQLSPVFQIPHWPYRAVPLRYWQSDNKTSTAVLPHLRATQKENLARPHSRSPQAVRKPEGLTMHCHLHRGDWSFHLTNEKKKYS